MMKAIFNRLRAFVLSKTSTLIGLTLSNTLFFLLSPNPLSSSSSSSSSSDPFLLATQIDLLHTHFNSYFSALDRASNDDVSQLLFLEWRNSLEKPFLWFGDCHPYIFTNLLRSFHEDDDDSDENDDRQKMELLGDSCNVWKNHDNSLGHFVDQVECGLRLMVPSIVARARDAQASLVEKLAVGWKEKCEKFEVDEIVQELVDEMTSVFLDANRLRRSVLSDIMGALNVYQAAFFLEGLAQFYVGFSDPNLFPQF